ncbi:hypothetical protein LTR37_001869 [Vermiconidia calcicola]|uniref:Uncharacterized protein n=1 Tax=Vermiconidia calcicola TaxID=1690605 RepID=A0ACC3NUF4_9PEZI|nr:hypothetical protein LTR37_001869 [Vermiconidia calcicola]
MVDYFDDGVQGSTSARRASSMLPIRRPRGGNVLDIAGENRVATYQTAKAETHREDEEDALLKQKRRQTRLFKLSDLVKWDDVGDEMDLRCRVKMLGAPSPASIHETRAKSVLPFASAKPRTTSTQRASIEIDKRGYSRRSRAQEVLFVDDKTGQQIKASMLADTYLTLLNAQEEVQK